MAVSKAQRYTPPSPSSRPIYTAKGLLLYFLPFPLVIGAITALVAGQVASTLILGGGFAAYMVSATIARHGFKLEVDYQRRKLARAPKTPYKTVAALFTATTTGVLAWLGAKYGPIESILMAGAAFLGFALSYGLDPRRNKAGNLSLGVSIDEVIDALEAAEIRIQSIDEAKRAIRNNDYTQRLDRITQKARDILATIEDDPTRLARARKFLKVYLDGTQKVTQGYARSQNNQTGVATALDTDFNRVLDSIEQTFDEQYQKLLENDNFDLDVQITVLEQQLKREGAF